MNFAEDYHIVQGYVSTAWGAGAGDLVRGGGRSRSDVIGLSYFGGE